MAATSADPARLDVEERGDIGRAARAKVSRSSHGDWSPAADRPDSVEVLEAQATTRVPELVPIRYGRMLATPFTFYRGAAAIMAADLGAMPHTALNVQLCGDAHISNFGGFGAPDRTLVFDLNDFDETLPGPWEWDVKRMAASIEIAGRDRRFPTAQRRALVAAAVAEYRAAMKAFAGQHNLDVWYARLDVDGIRDRYSEQATGKDLKAVRKTVAKAKSKDSLRALNKLTHVVDGRLRFISAPPLIMPIEDLNTLGAEPGDLDQWMRDLLDKYMDTVSNDLRHLLENYEYVHMARKVVGVGSVGTRAWVILLEGRDGNDPLVLQAKEAQASVLEPYAGASVYEEHGQRVVEGQRLMQAAGDIFLGWLRIDAPDGTCRDFYLRQLWDWKASVDISLMTPERLWAYVESCGWTLARAHARSGDRQAIAAYLGAGAGFDKAIVRFASAYADQNELDHAVLLQAAADGRIPIESGI